MSKATEAIVQAANPIPKMKGRFNLFDTPDGGLLISYVEDPTDEIPEPEIKRITIPGKILRAAKMMENGDMNPLQAFKMFAGMMTG